MKFSKQLGNLSLWFVLFSNGNSMCTDGWTLGVRVQFWKYFIETNKNILEIIIMP